MSDEHEQMSTLENLPGAAACPQRLWWILEQKEEILKLHSSDEWSDIFPLDCGGCKQYYQHCMFSKKERKSNNPMCRWCQVECEITQVDQFEIHYHIHCNKLGKKRCAPSYSLEPPKPPVPVIKPETRLVDVAPSPEVAFVVNRKMSQKERKAAAAAQRAAMGF